MKIEEFQRSLTEMSEEEIIDMILDIRKNRSKHTISEKKVKQVRAKAKATSVKETVKGLTKAEQAELRELFKM